MGKEQSGQKAACASGSRPGQLLDSPGIRTRLVLISYRFKPLGCDFLNEVMETCCLVLPFGTRPGDESSVAFAPSFLPSFLLLSRWFSRIMTRGPS